MAAAGGSWSKGSFKAAKGTQTTGATKRPVEYLYNTNFQGPQKVAALKALPKKAIQARRELGGVFAGFLAK